MHISLYVLEKICTHFMQKKGKNIFNRYLLNINKIIEIILLAAAIFSLRFVSPNLMFVRINRMCIYFKNEHHTQSEICNVHTCTIEPYVFFSVCIYKYIFMWIFLFKLKLYIHWVNVKIYIACRYV